MTGPCADAENFLRGRPSSNQGASDKVLPFQNPYPAKNEEGPDPRPPSGSAHEDSFVFCLQYEKNKSYCEDLTEGKFSFPLIHGVLIDRKDNQILNILSAVVKTHFKKML